MVPRFAADILYSVAIRSLSAAWSPTTPICSASGEQKAAAWITPDEMSVVIANVDAFKPIAAIKRLFSCGRDARRGSRRTGISEVGS
ncbi:MAG TPA: hypothetical protein VGJ20_13600 [Xanthobacteraceae bacterium]|jgi:hypothetical protein